MKREAQFCSIALELANCLAVLPLFRSGTTRMACDRNISMLIGIGGSFAATLLREFSVSVRNAAELDFFLG
jgi:hypothetical protein